MRIIPAKALTKRQISHWREIQAADPHLANPYFCPEYTLLLGAVRPKSFVAILEEQGSTIGYFPFQKNVLGVGKPLGGPLSDYQAVIVEPGYSVDPRELIQAAGLTIWDFDHLLAAQQSFAPYAITESSSPCIDLSCGYDQYIAKDIGSSSTYKRVLRHRRKLEREVGPLRFELHTEATDVLKKVIELKRKQCQSTGAPDFFAQGWTQELLRLLLSVQTPHFAGTLSALYAGDKLVAAHCGMRSANVLHWWFPVYEPAYAKYSPGLNLLLESARAAAESGLTLLDLGKGEESYKQTMMNAHIPLLEGSVLSTRRSRVARQLLDGIRHWQPEAAWLKPLELPGRALRRFDRWLCYR